MEHFIIIKKVIWQVKTPKIKHSALLINCELNGFKDTDIFYKLTGLQCFCVSNFLKKICMSGK